MSRRAMFWRMVTSSILRRRSRVLIAILAVAIGATTLSGLVTIAVDVPAQLAREIRSYGANLVVTPAGDVPITDEAVAAATAQVPASALVGSAAFDYETVTINDQPYVAGGADLEAVHAMNPYWFVDGEWPAATGQVLVGEQVASTIDVKAGDTITVSQLDASASSKAAAQSGAQASALKVDPRTVTLTVSGILKTGGNEDGYIYMSADDMAELTGAWEPSIAQYSVALEGDQLTALVDSINASVPSVRAQTVKRLVQSDSGVIDMLRSLLGLITVIVLALTTIGVSTTMIAVVTERRNEIGLRKALGATSRSIMGEFMGEGVALGAIGGLVGAAAGYALAAAISWNVFHRAVAVHPLVLIATVVSSVAVAVVACLPPVRRALAIDPALVLRGE